jgi:hypothetical protein
VTPHTCTKRKFGFNGARYCGKPATWQIDLTVGKMPTVLYACTDCAEPFLARGEVKITRL